MKKYTISSLAIVGLALFILGFQVSGVKASPGLVTADLDTGVTATGLVNTLLGPGVTVSNVTYTGENRAAGTFSGGTGIIDFESGIILSTGDIADVVGPNTFTDTTTDNGQPGDSDLDSLVPGYTTFDAAVLEFDFVPTTSVISFQYVFGSEEYNEYVNSEYNDVFGFFINGVNQALIPGTTTPVAINNVNGGNPYYGTGSSNPNYYRNNDCWDPTGVCSIDTQLDGLTVVLTVTANVTPGATNHIRLAIADAGDTILDSDVFIKAQSFTAPSLTLEPILDTNNTGTSHSLTATATLNGVPQQGVTVTFNITSGPHAGTTGSMGTNASGQATWSYSGTSPGTDTIEATATIGQSSQTSNKAYKTWKVPYVISSILSLLLAEFPDLTIEITGLQVSCPGGQGTCMHDITFDITNLAPVDVMGPFDVKVSTDHGLSSVITEPGLAAGATVPRTVILGPGNNCYNPNCEVTVDVDTGDAIPESDETNNLDTEIFEG